MSEAVSKYRAKKTEYNGEIYDSKAEARFAMLLDFAKRERKDMSIKVVDVKRQFKYRVHVEGVHICTYKLDFLVTYANGTTKHFDVKGYRTPVYKLKKKLVEAIYKIKIIEVK